MSKSKKTKKLIHKNLPAFKKAHVIGPTELSFLLFNNKQLGRMRTSNIYDM